LGKIAEDVRLAVARRAGSGAKGRAEGRALASGEGWSVSDVICTSGPRDRPFEEQHSGVSIAIVIAGTFQYRSTSGRDMLTPGSLLLGNPGECFECGHEHAVGDRCISFSFAPGLFTELADGRRLRAPSLPPLPELTALASRAAAGATADVGLSWEEIAVELAATAVRLTSGGNEVRPGRDAASLRRITESVRRIEAEPGEAWTLTRLASEAAQSPYHYLRTFQEITGVTPHQFVLRARLRAAALGLLTSDAKIIDVALNAGFGDVSNFNTAFRRELGTTPRAFRRMTR
jgi:AraC-like DNA-binding protein